MVLQDGTVVRDRPAREVLSDVQFLEETGIMPLGVPRFFHEIGASEQLPLTLEEGIEEFLRGWRN